MITSEQYNDVVAEQLKRYDGVVPSFRMYKHAPNGVYDYSDHQTRVFVYEGFGFMIATRTWVEDPVANIQLPVWMREPWNAYPDMPPKPAKK